MGHLMTATLLSAYEWMVHAPPSWRESAKDDFFAKIRRQDKFTPTPEIQRGMQFENLICTNVNSLDEEEFLRHVFTQTCSLCRAQAVDLNKEEEVRIIQIIKEFYYTAKGANQQVKLAKNITVDDEEFYLFGYADLIKDDHIMDIKTCTKFKREKYTTSPQHLIYQYCTGFTRFDYLVCSWEGNKLPTAYYDVDVTAKSVEESEAQIRNKIRNLMTFLKSSSLWDDYIKLFCRGK